MPADRTAALPLTGERTVPGVPEENYWFRRHEAACEDVLAEFLGHAGPTDPGRLVRPVKEFGG